MNQRPERDIQRTLRLLRNRPGLGLRDAQMLLADPWMQTLTEPLQIGLLQAAVVHQVPARFELCMQGAAPEMWFGVARGGVKLSTGGAEGRETVIDLLEPGQWFGDGPLLTGEAQPYSAQTLAASTLLLITRGVLRTLLASTPELATALARLNWMRAVRIMQRLHEQSAPSLEQRVRRHLNSLAERFGSSEGEGVQIELPLAQTDLALMTHGSRQRVNAVLARLERMGEVTRGRGAAFGVSLRHHPLAEPVL